MITLEKILTELKAESLNEIVAGINGHANVHIKIKGAKGAGGGSSDESESVSMPSETTGATESGEVD